MSTPQIKDEKTSPGRPVMAVRLEDARDAVGARPGRGDLRCTLGIEQGQGLIRQTVLTAQAGFGSTSARREDRLKAAESRLARRYVPEKPACFPHAG